MMCVSTYVYSVLCVCAHARMCMYKCRSTWWSWPGKVFEKVVLWVWLDIARGGSDRPGGWSRERLSVHRYRGSSVLRHPLSQAVREEEGNAGSCSSSDEPSGRFQAGRMLPCLLAYHITPSPEGNWEERWRTTVSQKRTKEGVAGTWNPSNWGETRHRHHSIVSIGDFYHDRTFMGLTGDSQDRSSELSIMF